MDLNPAEEPLPPLYARWAADLLGGPIPRESRATCDNCAMCPSSPEELGPKAYFFDPAFKCCTYVPELHNFLVGRILADTDPAAQTGRASVEKRLDAGISVTPLGLTRSALHTLLYDHSDDSFGRSRSLVCPHYLEDSGRCGIWRNRESTCVTWFCKHVRGTVGQSFWLDHFHRLMMLVEKDLARWCVLQLCSIDVVQRLATHSAWTSTSEPVTGDSLDQRVDPDAYAQAWGEWKGREREFFLRCADMVGPLSWSDVLSISGMGARVQARLTQEAYRKLTSDEIPEQLEVGTFQIVQIARGNARVTTYSDYDPLDVPRALMDLLYCFDGRPTADVLKTIVDERQIRLEPDLVRKMVDFGLLASREPVHPADEKPVSGRS